MPDRSPCIARSSLLPFALAAALAAPCAMPQEAPPVDEIEVHGTVIVETPEGAELDAETGQIKVVVQTPSGPNGWSGSPTEVWLIDGEFTLKVSRRARLEIQAFVLDDGVACLVPDDSAPQANDAMGHDEHVVAIPADGKLALRAVIPPPTVLIVVDAESGEPLDKVDVLLDLWHDDDRSTMVSPHMLGEGQLHPTPWWSSDFLARAARSPVPLKYDTERTFGSWRESVWVHAPWRCWAGVEVDYRVGGEQRIALAPGGVVFGKVDQEVPKGTRFCLRKAHDPGEEHRRMAELLAQAKGAGDGVGEGEGEGESDEASDEAMEEFDFDFNNFGLFGDLGALAEWPIAKESPAKLDGIPAGRYRATLEIGERFGNRQTLAETTVTVVVGKPALATFALDGPVRAPEPVAVHGEIRLAPGWEGTELHLFLQPGKDVSPLAQQVAVHIDDDELVRDSAQPGVVKTRQLQLSPGGYSLTIDPIGIHQTFRVTRATPDFTVEIPAPVDATIRLVDARTREPVVCDGLEWSVAEAGFCLVGRLVHISGFRSADGDDAPHSTWKVRVPAGSIAVNVHVDGYEWDESTLVTITAEQPEAEVALRHITGVRATMVRDGKAVDWEKTLEAAPAIDDTRRVLRSLGYGDFGPEIEPLDANGRAIEVAKGEEDEHWMFLGNGSSADGRYFVVPHAGRYRVTFPALKGFEPFPPFDVVVAEQQFTDVQLQLVPVKAE